MVIKSLTITEEAYNSLRRRKMNNESFSEVIVRISNEKKGASSSFFGCLSNSKDSLEHLQNKVKEYRKKYSFDADIRMKNLKGQLE